MRKNTISNGKSSIEHIPERGGLITSIKILNEDILYLNHETLNNLTKNVRGGIPVLFPNAGPLLNSNIYKLKQHGFARNMVWQYKNTSKTDFLMYLESSIETRKFFNYDFKIEIITKIISDSEVEIIQKIINTGASILPVSPGLHPYYYIKDEEKKSLKIYFNDRIFDDDFSWCEGNTVYLDNPSKIKLLFPNGKIIVLNYDKSYERLWIWSEKGKDFICVEPIFRDENSIIDNPLFVKIGEEKTFKLTISK